MENDQELQNPNQRDIGVENLPLARLKDAFKKIDTAYHYWRFQGVSTVKAMENVGISSFYFGQVIKFFEYFLSQENGGELFPEPRIRQQVRDAGYYAELSKRAALNYAALSQLQKEELGLVVSFELFALLMKGSAKGIERPKYDSEGQMKQFKFEEGHIVKKIYTSKANEVKYDHVRYRVVGFEGSLVVVKSLGSKNPKRVHPSILKFADEVL